MNRRQFVAGSGVALAVGMTRGEAVAASAEKNVRGAWIRTVEKTAGPVLTALSQRRLKLQMPVECKPGQEESRRQCTYLEALGRTLCGIAPWLESGGDAGRYPELAREAIAAGVDPASPDYLNFGTTAQSLVDAAFLALGILRAPVELNQKLPAKVKEQLITALEKTRVQKAGMNNWLLFAATVEAAIAVLGGKWLKAPVELALTRHREWYLGDGVYGDGPHFHADYYDSFVIHPFLLAVLESPVGEVDKDLELTEVELQRAMRYAAIQERMIGRDGTWPVVGRSIAYRCGAFHLLAEMARRQHLPQHVSPAQVRGALTAAMNVSLGARGSYDAKGWLTIGLAGHQPGLGEPYISTGSLYLCLEAFLPLGLTDRAPFWSDVAEDWTAKKAWAGVDMPADHAVDG
ncbi:DUF2264 domain-containing protein [Terriglobus tenax]|uniref:DUF2264 domain-containing protein n=1 Tax=Terriglobus tenax TaxID=1111115 RepID=UPI0021E0F472|nr:DUF2264 domain-containing protein [Terriglobus tenax]